MICSSKYKEFTFTWKIRNICSCFQNNEQDVTSPTFTVKTLWNSKWYLNFLLRGNVNSEKFVSCYVVRKNDGQKRKIYVDFSIAMFSENDKKIKSFSAENNLFKSGKSLGWDEFIQYGELINLMKNNSFDILTVRCFIINAQKKETICKASTTICVERYSFEWTENKNLYDTKITNLEYLSLPLKIKLELFNEILHISIVSFNSKSSFLLNLRICLLDVNGTENHSKEDSHFFKSENYDETWTFPDFLTTTLLNSEEFTPNEMFTLKCDLRVSKAESESTLRYIEHFTLESSPCADSEEVSDCSNKLEFFGQAETLESSPNSNNVEFLPFADKLESPSCADIVVNLQSFLREVLKDKKHSDVKLKVEDKFFYAHRNILSARSPVFLAMFDSDMAETRTGEIYIEDINSETLEQFLQFVYTESLDITNCDHALELLLVADKYQVQSLIEKCSLFLSTHLSNENACEILVAADMFGLKNLKTKLLDFIQAHAAKILKSPDWLQWSQKNIKLASEIFSKLIDLL